MFNFFNRFIKLMADNNKTVDKMLCFLLFVSLTSLVFIAPAQGDATPIESTPLATPKIQHGIQQPLAGAVDDYLVSEKLDGVRGYWDGQRLLSRSGRLINPPAWFIEHFPGFALDGELWLGRGKFEQMSGLSRRKQPVDEAWRDVKFMVFDLPTHPQPFMERYAIACDLLNGVSPYLAVVEQKSLADTAALTEFYETVISGGGEGLMLHRKQAYYQVGRNDHIIKLKPFYDAEAKVLAHLPGKGEFSGLLGSILVRNSAGQEFKIGSGFTLSERREPPAIGSTVTYQYSGYTQTGLPRFASFLRQRDVD